LEKMVAAREDPFDLVFIDADKQSYPVYLDYAMRLTRPGSLLLADNVIRDGKVARDDESDPLVKGVQEFNRKLAANPNLEAILVTIMRESLDGLAIARIKD
jgi:predicted O-methyltransferase YrrM